MEAQLSRRNFHPELTPVVEDGIVDTARPGVGVARGVELAVRSGQVNSRAGELSRLRVHRPHRQHTHGPLPPPVGDANRFPLAAVGFQERELRETPLVRNVRNPLPIGRPAWMKGIVLEERQLVGLAARGRLDVEVRELIRGAAGRGCLLYTSPSPRD